MKLKPIIDQLKVATTSFNGRIAGASEYAAGVESTRLVVPCAFVMRGQVFTDEARTLGEVVQMMTEEFGIAVAVDNSQDERGQMAEELLDDIRQDLIQALLGWAPDETHNAMEYGGDVPIEINRGRLWRLFVFRTSGAIASLDL
jgi:hypothetical protein